jgi:hypothetical protein
MAQCHVLHDKRGLGVNTDRGCNNERATVNTFSSARRANDAVDDGDEYTSVARLYSN